MKIKLLTDGVFVMRLLTFSQFKTKILLPLFFFLLGGIALGQTTVVVSTSATTTAWANQTWTPARTASNWTTTDIAQFGSVAFSSTAGAPFGINFNSSTFKGNLSIGAIDFASTLNKSLFIGSTSTGGTLTLNGVTVNSVSNTVLRNNSTFLNTLFTGTNGIMTVALANDTDNVIQIDNTGGITISTVISGSNKKLTKAGSGSGVLTLSAVNTYSGATTIKGGTLQLGIANAIPTAATGYGVVLNGGTLKTGASTGFSNGSGSANMGTLTLSSNSTIALGSGSHSLYFANSSATTWNGTLTITGFTSASSNAGVTGSAGRIFVGNATGNLTADQLSKITFTGTYGGVTNPHAMQLSTGEIVPTAKSTPTISGSGSATDIILGQTLASSTISGFTASVPGTFAFTAPTTAPANAGTAIYGVTFTPTDTASYNNATTTVSVTTLPATPTVTATGTTTYTYNGSPQGPASATNTGNGSSYTFSYSGIEEGGATYTATATRPTNAGSYEMVATVNATSNYNSASSAPLAFVINKAASTITVTGDNFYAFDGNPQGPTTYDHTGSAGSVTFHYTGINGTDYPENTTIPTAVGSYKAVATLAADNNYNGAVSDDFNYQITSVAIPEITSALTWSQTYGVAVTAYTVTASNNPTSFGVSGLPAGLTYSAVTKEITGTPTAAPGNYNVSLTATNEGGTSDAVTLEITIGRKDVTITDVFVSNKTYDGNNTATLTGTADGFVNGDDVALALSANFADANAGQDKPVTSTSTLTGTKANYYNLVQPTGLTADIAKATPGVTATGATTYTYNGLVQGPASATVTPSAAGTATYSYSGTGNDSEIYGPSSTRPTNAGTYSMIATVEESANYNAASSPAYAFTIEKAAQALTGFGNNITKLSTDAPFDLPAAITTTGGQQVTYTVTDTPDEGVATVSGNTVTITGLGTTGITAQAEATPNYNAYNASINLTVNFNTALAPTASAATNILGTGFTANWSSVFGATSYELDVYTKSTVNNQVEVFNATFSDLNGTGGNDNVWTGNIGTNSLSSYTNAGWTFSSSGGAKECIKSGTGGNSGVVTTPTLSSLNGNAVLTFRAGGFSTDNTVLSVSITGGGSISGNSTFSLVNSSFSSYTVNIVGGTSNTKLTFSSSSGGQRFFIDDIRVVSGSVITTTTSIAGAPFTISAQNPQPTNYSNTLVGLNRDTQYYYVVRAINGSSETGNSNEIAVKTTNAVVWDGSNWSNSGEGPDATLDAEITGNYSISEGFEANNLTITESGSLTIQPDQGVTINGDITMPDDKLTIESDGSLVQTKITDGNSDNKAIAKRKVNMRTADYTFWSSPLKDQILRNTTNGNADNSTGGFSEGTPNSRTYQYREEDDTFRATADATFVPAKGYAIRGKSTYGEDLAADELAFRGNLHNGDISIQVQKSRNTTSNGVTYEHGYNLIGNPYPSNIDFIKFYNLDNNRNVIFGKAWFWSNFIVAPSQQGGSGYEANNYAILSLAGSSPATGIDTENTIGSPMPTEFIKVAQGFIVQMRATPPTGTNKVFETLKFDNSIRANNSGHFYNSKTNSTVDRYWLKMTSPYNIANTILVAHINGATDNYDADYDAELLAIGDDSFYSKLNAMKLQIQARQPLVNNEDVIALGTKHAADGVYKIALGNKEGVFSSTQNVYLKDKLLNKIVNLSEGAYSYQAVKGTDETRFEIVYKDASVLGSDTVKISDFMVYRDGNSYVVNSAKKLGAVEVYDTAGRLVKSLKTNDSKLRIDVSGLSNGVYILKAENSGDAKTKKILK